MYIILNMDDTANFTLVRPAPEYSEAIQTFRNELIETGSAMDGTGPLKHSEDPEEFIRECILGEDPKTVRRGLVPATQFLFVDPADGTVIGMISVRHELNDSLRRLGGHIGYCIRPSYRGHGYAKVMLGEALNFCRDTLHLPWVMLSCHADNPASEHTIRGCGGILERTSTDPENGTEVLIFTIPLSES